MDPNLANNQGGNSGGGNPPGDGGNQPPVVVERPQWLPENHWDAEKGAIKDDFGAHYTEISTAQRTEAERKAALAARKAEDIKFEVKLPPEVKVPDGMKITIDEKDPRIPYVRDLALKNGWDQETVNALVAVDAQVKIQQHGEEVTRIAAEDAKLGANGKDRKAAVATWADGLKTKGDISADEYEEIRFVGATAAGVTLLEKLIAKINGSVPGQGGNPPQTQPVPATVEERWYAKKG